MKKDNGRAGRGGMSGPVISIYEILYEYFGPQGWWPVTAAGETKARYSGGPVTDDQRFEVAAGAVLTQNTSWTNASGILCGLTSTIVLALYNRGVKIA